MELLRLQKELNRYKNSMSDSFVVVTVCRCQSDFWGESPLEWRAVSEWRPFGMAAPRNGGPQPTIATESESSVVCYVIHAGVTGHSIPRHQNIPRVKPAYRLGYTPGILRPRQRGMNWPRPVHTPKPQYTPMISGVKLAQAIIYPGGITQPRPV